MPAATTAPTRAAQAPKLASKPSRRLAFWIILIAMLALGAYGLRRLADDHLRAMSILMRLSDPKAQGFMTRFSRQPFAEASGMAQTPHDEIKYRLYTPTGVAHPPGVILLHGIHRAGIEEPRLINFARTLAGAGYEVMTPELKDLADYRITTATIDTI